MDFWGVLQIYLIVAAALAGTSYLNLYRPAIQLLEEIMERKVPRYNGVTGTIIWLLIAFIVAPITAILLLNNNNIIFIERLAVSLANGLIEEEEEEEE